MSYVRFALTLITLIGVFSNAAIFAAPQVKNKIALQVTALKQLHDFGGGGAEGKVRATDLLFRQNRDAEINGGPITFGNPEIDTLKIEANAQVIEPAEPFNPQPIVLSGPGFHLRWFQIRNHSAHELKQKFQNEKLLVAHEDQLSIIAEPVSNSLVVLGLDDESEADFTALVRRHDIRPVMLKIQLNVMKNRAGRTVVVSSPDIVTVLGLKSSIVIGGGTHTYIIHIDPYMMVTQDETIEHIE